MFRNVVKHQHSHMNVKAATKVQSHWGNGHRRAQWEKNLTCLRIDITRSGILTTGATHLQTLAQTCSQVQQDTERSIDTQSL